MATAKRDLKIQGFANELRNDPEYIAEGLAIKIIEEVLAFLKQRGMSQSWLAEQLGVSRAHVSQILKAPPNMTLLTIAKLAVVIGSTPSVWLRDVPSADSPRKRFAIDAKMGSMDNRC